MKKLIVGVICLWTLAATSGFWFSWASEGDAFKDAGQFGDMFGAVNALFSGLAFALLIQSNRIQQKEMHETKQELAGQKIAMQSQVEQYSMQGFERNFFELLSVHRGNLGSVSHGLANGSNAISFLLEDFTKNLSALKFYPFVVGPDDRGTAISDAHVTVIGEYEGRYRGYEQQVGHYFRGLYLLINLVDLRGGKDARFFAKIVRAQLSKSELIFIFYNGLSVHGLKMKPLIEKYSLLKHLSRQDVLCFEQLSQEYKSDAFGVLSQ